MQPYWGIVGRAAERSVTRHSFRRPYGGGGAAIVGDGAAGVGEADIVLKVQRPLMGGEDGLDELSLLKHGAVLIGLLRPLRYPADADAYARAGITGFAMELIPRITRAQTMDVLSSQANLPAYTAVLYTP